MVLSAKCEHIFLSYSLFYILLEIFLWEVSSFLCQALETWECWNCKVSHLSRETFPADVMYWSLLTPVIIHNNAPGVRSTAYRSIILLLFQNFIIFLSFHSSCTSKIHPHSWFSNVKNPFSRSSDRHYYPPNRVKPSCDVFICNVDVVMRRNAS